MGEGAESDGGAEYLLLVADSRDGWRSGDLHEDIDSLDGFFDLSTGSSKFSGRNSTLELAEMLSTLLPSRWKMTSLILFSEAACARNLAVGLPTLPLMPAMPTVWTILEGVVAFFCQV